MNFLKNKKLGYYLMCAAAVLSIVLGIVFLATMKDSLPNSALGIGPETVAVWAFVAAVIEIAALFVPEHKWVQVLAVAAIAGSLMKEVRIIPNLIADEINNVHYQGGDLGTNIVYMVLIFAVAILGIVSCFLPVTTDEKIDLKPMSIVRYGGAGAAILAAALVGFITTATLESKIVTGGDDTREEPKFAINLEETFGDKVDASYTFNPAEVRLSKDENEWATKSNNERKNAVGSKDPSKGQMRDGVNLLYRFEGAYAEGWQGDYSKHYAYIYVWEDGLYNGSSNGTAITGYWYNKVDGTDDNTLYMIDDRGADNDMVCNTCTSKFYDWVTEVKSTLNNGRTIKSFGYLYQPTIGFYVDPGVDEVKVASVEDIDTSEWVGMRVLNDFKTGAVFDADANLKFSAPKDGADDNHKIVTATWKDEGKEFTWDTVVTIDPSLAEAAE